MPWEYTPHNLTCDECALVTASSSGRALEFGSGQGLGTHALLAARCYDILSIDQDINYTETCKARFTDPRVVFVHADLTSDGWYKQQDVPVPPVGERYNTVLLDGPTGYPARAHCLPMLLEHHYLEDDWLMLVTHAAETPVKAFIKQWLQKYPIIRDTDHCPRGMIIITPVV